MSSEASYGIALIAGLIALILAIIATIVAVTIKRKSTKKVNTDLANDTPLSQSRII